MDELVALAAPLVKKRRSPSDNDQQCRHAAPQVCACVQRRLGQSGFAERQAGENTADACGLSINRTAASQELCLEDVFPNSRPAIQVTVYNWRYPDAQQYS
jgi:hypothetical protein